MAKITKGDAEDTKEKICEAQYFLNRVGETQNDPKPFNCNLGAFLAAFRSIHHFMEKEFDDPKLDPCYKQLQKWMENDPHVRLLTEERNITTHERIISKRNALNVHVSPLNVSVEVVQPSVRVVNENGSVTESPSPKEVEPAPATEETGDEDKPSAEYTWYFTLTGNTRNDQKIRDIPGINTIIQTDVVTICKDCFKDLKNRVATCDKDLIPNC